MDTGSLRGGSFVDLAANAVEGISSLMNTPQHDLDAEIHSMEIFISWVLRAGVSLSLALLLLGLIFMLSGLERIEFGTKIANAGLVVLIATPIVRVALSVGAFAKQKNWRFTFITLLVLVLLGISFLLGNASG
jgi:uncharacterized membrane protein